MAYDWGLASKAIGYACTSVVCTTYSPIVVSEAT